MELWYKEKDLQKTLLYYQRKKLKNLRKRNRRIYSLQIARVLINSLIIAKGTYLLIESEYGDIIIDKRIHFGRSLVEINNISLLAGILLHL
jgi:hypothetical protein